MYLYRYIYVQQSERAESMDDECAGDGRGVCVFRAAVIQMGKIQDCALN